ncbi:Putative nudix hydrolase fgf-2, partial [Gryllus bimaculatus]
MCRVIVPVFRILLEISQNQWHFRKLTSSSSYHLLSLRFMEMSSSGGEQHTSTIFQGKKDIYKGIVVNSSEASDGGCFSITLEESLKYWRTNNVRTVWFNVALEQADWIPELAKNGFKFHHIKGDDVVMYKWLPENEECNIPSYCHTMVGVGSVVINSDDEILVIQERFSTKQQWKLPGGYVEPGENIGDAAVREVFEETNVQAEFQYLATFRHMHNANFGCSDIYFIACLKPLSDKIEKCNKEIKACQWMKVEEFLDHPLVHEGNKFFVRKCIEYQKEGNSIGCVQSIHPAINKHQCVYSIMTNKDIPPYMLKYATESLPP